MTGRAPPGRNPALAPPSHAPYPGVSVPLFPVVTPSSHPPSPSSRPRPAVREEHVTATGWRLVGDAVSLAEQAAKTAPLSAGRDEDVLYAARFHARPRLGRHSAVFGILTILGAAVARDWHDAPPLTRDHDLVRPHGRFHGLRWQVAGEVGSWRGELVWRHPHPVVSGAPCTTHVVAVEQQRHSTLSIRVSADAGLASVRGVVGAGQARPIFLGDMSRALRLSCFGDGGEPRVLGDVDIEQFVRDELLAERRDYPVAVLAPLEEGGHALSPADVAEELLGLAPLFVVDRHPATFRLSDTLGDRRLSCYWGALRVYMPGFSCADRPEDHPLLVRERLMDPVDRAGLVGKLGLLAGRRLRTSAADDGANAPSPASDNADAEPGPAGATSDAESPSIAAAPTAVADADAAPELGAELPAGLAVTLAPMPPLLLALGTQIGALAATITQLVESNAALSDEIARLRTTTAVRAGNTTALERRVGSLEQLLRRQFDSVDAPDAVVAAGKAPGERTVDDDTDSLTLLDVLRQAAAAHSDSLLVLDAAERSAADSPFEDVDRVAVILDAMAALARRRQEGALGMPLRTAFRELGIDYRGAIAPSTSERQRQQYQVYGADGRPYECREHIVLGTSYDPRYCLRIYFTSRAPVEARFVIAHVGRHFDVASTS